MNSSEDASSTAETKEYNQSNSTSSNTTLDNECRSIFDVFESSLPIENNGLEQELKDFVTDFAYSNHPAEAPESESLLQHLPSNTTDVDFKEESEYFPTLSNAAYLGDWRRVDEYIAMGMDVNSTNQTGVRNISHPIPLYAVLDSKVVGNHLEDVNHIDSDLTVGEYIVTRLIEAKADIHCLYGDYLPLHYAAEKGQTVIVKLLLKSGFGVYNRLIHVLLTCNLGFNLHIFESIVNFSSKSDISLFNSLLNGSYGVNMRLPRSLITPLHLASTYEVAQALIDARADINATIDNGTTPLVMAAMKGHDGAVKCLMQYKDQMVLSPSRDQIALALETAIIYNRPSIVDILMQYGADVNADLPHSKSRPLDVALLTFNSNIMIVDKLLQHGANPNNISVSPWPPLFNVVVYKDKWTDVAGFTESLIKSKADVNKKAFGKTLLHSALERDLVGVVELLIRSNADLNLVDLSGFTCLHQAVEFNDKYSTDMLQDMLRCIQQQLQE